MISPKRLGGQTTHRQLLELSIADHEMEMYVHALPSPALVLESVKILTKKFFFSGIPTT